MGEGLNGPREFITELLSGHSYERCRTLTRPEATAADRQIVIESLLGTGPHLAGVGQPASMSTTKGTAMSNNPNELTMENSAVVLIDHQPWVAYGVRSIDNNLMMKNVAALCQAARDLNVPTVLTTVGAEGGILVDPIFTEISDVFPDIKPIDRSSTNAWPDIRAAVEATGRKKLIMAGIVTEVCLAQSVLAALKDGFDVYFVSDCSGGLTPESHEDAKARMMQAGAKPMSWAAVIAEWVPDYLTPEGAIRGKVLQASGGMLKLQSDYPLAQVEAGLVSLPESLSFLAPAG